MASQPRNEHIELQEQRQPALNKPDNAGDDPTFKKRFLRKLEIAKVIWDSSSFRFAR